ncbi:hypothetical protein [Saccharopolyspora phatthalungensis]|uniref:Uncharacterized protein n=1 Tax=Saccharopolyspora phatthalungensis TaxID=664693 RepID=A0A840QDU1_9PSEU|nr:hypothetical protein [Saccharopolyspora phatthalungensis]MBB5156828.1 hypothetical protein [Saccharopolyspora phatthalungensis]
MRFGRQAQHAEEQASYVVFEQALEFHAADLGGVVAEAHAVVGQTVPEPFLEVGDFLACEESEIGGARWEFAMSWAIQAANRSASRAVSGKRHSPTGSWPSSAKAFDSARTEERSSRVAMTWWSATKGGDERKFHFRGCGLASKELMNFAKAVGDPQRAAKLGDHAHQPFGQAVEHHEVEALRRGVQVKLLQPPPRGDDLRVPGGGARRYEREVPNSDERPFWLRHKRWTPGC